MQALMSDFYLFEYSDMKKIEIFLNLDDKNENSKFRQNEDSKLIDLFIKMDCDQDGLISCEDLFDFVSKRKIKICQNELQNFILQKIHNPVMAATTIIEISANNGC